MKLMQFNHRLPYPLIDGGKKSAFGFAKGFSGILGPHDFGMICLAPEQEQHYDIAPLRALANSFHVFYRNFDNKPIDLIRNTLFGGDKPYNSAKYMLPDIRDKVLEIVGQFQPDVIQFQHLHSAYYAKAVRAAFPNILIALRQHNVESTLIRRVAENETNPVKKFVMSIQAKRLFEYERNVLRVFDLVLPITQPDNVRMEAMAPGTPQMTVPSGTDFPLNMPPPSNCMNASIIHVAAMDWLPNQGALRWFIDSVMPLIRAKGVKVTLHAVGKNMPPEMSRLAAGDIVIHGFLMDIKPLLREACIAVVPLSVGGGMRIKIVDYMSEGIPVVSTTIGAEGISDGSDGSVLIADNPQDFADAVVALLQDRDLRERVRTQGFSVGKARFDWPSLCAKVFERYQTMLANRLQR
jgi:glycosyltransferase involved in cell wall biosynthesis